MYLKDLHTPHLGGYSLNPSIEGTKLMLYKSTKVLAGVCCALLICLTLFTENAKAQPNCLDMAIADAISCETLTLGSIIVADPMYNMCPIEVLYSKRKCIFLDPNCPGGTRESIVIIITGLVWDWDSEDCLLITSFLNPPNYPDNFSLDPNRFRTFFNDLVPKFSDALFEEFYADGNPIEVRCGGTYPYCGDPDPLDCPEMTISVATPRCQDVCVYDLGNGIHHFGFADCLTSETACCVYKNYYCACTDAMGNLMQVKVVRESEPIVYPFDPEISCGTAGQPQGCPLYGVIPESGYMPCYQQCGR